MPLLTPALLASLLALTGPAQSSAGNGAAANVRVYRCVGSNGQVALQDVPCRQGQQQVLELARPKDPPPVAAPTVQAPPPATPVAAPAPPRVIVVREEPLFECITPEGGRYTADDGEGNPRWVPGPLVAVHVGTLIGHPGTPSRPPPHRPLPPVDSGGRHHHPPAHRPHASMLVPAGGQWVRDSCQRLTRQEACRVLDQQRWELIGRYNSALSSEREELVRQQRRVEERMERQPCNR